MDIGGLEKRADHFCHLQDRLGNIMSLLAHQVETSFDAVQVGVQDFHEDSLLGREVVVKSTLAYPGSLANLSHTGSVIAGFREKLIGGCKDFMACFFTAMLHANPFIVQIIPTGRYYFSLVQ
jgi:hypothetical protein